jgi:RNA polymerase sigma-70 factor, ECF subfamily
MMNSLTATLKSQFRSPRPVDYDRIEKKDEGMTMNNTSQSRISIPAELIQRSREGDHQAMEQIYERLKSPFFGLIFRYTRDKAAAEDVLQDVFIKIFTNLDKLDKDEAFLGWAYRIAVNTGLSHIRHNKMLLRKSIPLNGINHTLGDSEADGRENLLKRSLEKAMEDLTSKLKSVFVLHDVQGFKHHEIAQIMGCSVGTSKSQLFKARKKIRKILQKEKVLGEYS